MQFNPGFNITLKPKKLEFEYGDGVRGPAPEFRRLNAIRPSLKDPGCTGPDPVYGIAMDVGREQDFPILKERMLLFGAVAYASGQLGEEPVRSQGHVHSIAPHCGWSTPEWFEIWEGTAIIYAQQRTEDDPGICVAVKARVGEQVIVPPGWAHCVINADSQNRMAFGALCDRQYAFEYAAIRRHHGLAWFPVFRNGDRITWERNPHYNPSTLVERVARDYPELVCRSGVPLYQQFLDSPDMVNWVSNPASMQHVWPTFIP